MSDLLGGQMSTSTSPQSFLDAHDRLLADLGWAMSNAPAGQELADAASAYAETLGDALAEEDAERLVDAYSEYLEALQDALHEGDPSLDEALHEYLRGIQQAWLEVDLDELDVEALASVAQGTMAAAWLMTASRRGEGSSAPGPAADFDWDGNAGGDRHMPGDLPDENGIVWQNLAPAGWATPSSTADVDFDGEGDVEGGGTDYDYEYVDEREADWDGGVHQGADEEHNGALQWHVPGSSSTPYPPESGGIEWQELRPRTLRPSSTSFEPMAREEDDMADETKRRRTPSAAKRTSAGNRDAGAAPATAPTDPASSPVLSAGLDEALSRYLQDVRDAFAPADVRSRAEEAYKEYQRVVSDITQATDLQQQITDLFAVYSRTLQGLGSYDDVARAYLRVLQAGFDGGELVERLADTYQELVRAVVDASRPERRQASLNKAYDAYTRAVQDAWAGADTATLAQEDLLAAAHSMATATVVQVLGSATVAQPAAVDQTVEASPTPDRRPAAKRTGRTWNTGVKAAAPVRKAAAKRSTATKRSNSSGRSNSGR